LYSCWLCSFMYFIFVLKIILQTIRKLICYYYSIVVLIENYYFCPLIGFRCISIDMFIISEFFFIKCPFVIVCSWIFFEWLVRNMFKDIFFLFVLNGLTISQFNVITINLMLYWELINASVYYIILDFLLYI